MKKILAVCCGLLGLLSQETQAERTRFSVVADRMFKQYEQGVREGIATVMEKTKVM